MKSVLVIGMGNFGVHIAKEIIELGHEVMAVDKDEERINKVMPFVTAALIGDTTNEDFIKELGVNNFDVCLVAIGDSFQSSLETTFLLKANGAKKVISRATHDAQAKFLLSNGADNVVYPDKQLAKWTAVSCCSNHLSNYIELDDEYALYEVDTPSKWVGKTIKDLDIRNNYKVNVVAVIKDNKKDYLVGANTMLEEGSKLLVLGGYEYMKKYFNI